MVANSGPTGFTDEELRKLKELVSWRDGESCYTLPGEQIEAIIQRLDRAEQLTAFASCKCKSLDQCNCGFLKTYVRWKKSAGKAV